MDAPRLLWKRLADVFGLARHARKRFVQTRQRRLRGDRLCRRGRREFRRTALQMRRRRQLADARSLAMRTEHQMTLALVAKRLAGSEPALEAVSLIAKEINDYHMVPGTGIEPVRLAARDFKSLVSTNFTIRARELLDAEEYWRRDPESNRGTRLCRPLCFVVNQSLTMHIHPLSARSKYPTCQSAGNLALRPT